MAVRRVNIDDIVASNALELVIGGKVFSVKDPVLKDFLKLQAETANAAEDDLSVLHRQLAVIFDVDVEEVEGIGLRSASLAVAEVFKWATGDNPLIKTDEEEGEEPARP